MLAIIQIKVLEDNYIYLIHDETSGETAVIDPALAQPVLDVLDEKGWRLTYVLNTHHHWDHVEGNLELKNKTACKVVAAQADWERVPAFDLGVNDGDAIFLGKYKVQVIATPGHTSGHVVYYSADNDALFCGDTLFVMGCGRLFDGTAEQMYQSLQAIKALPPETRVYCAHEYTQTNGRFALSVDPDNVLLQEKMREVVKLREVQLPTVPSSIGEERSTNPFFRVDSLSIQKSLGLLGESPEVVFKALRKRKDTFS
ncbi:MAG: hydroxyacylglutathione hydrolase [Methylococcales bacterium]